MGAAGLLPLARPAGVAAGGGGEMQFLPSPRPVCAAAQVVIPKENNFAQAGARWRSFDPERQQRFIGRVAGMLLDPRCVRWRAPRALPACGRLVSSFC